MGIKETIAPWEKPISVELEPSRLALLLVDLQNWCAHPDHALGKLLHKYKPAQASYFFDRLERIVVPNSLRLLTFFREKGLQVVFLTVGPELPDWSDLFPRRRRLWAAWMEESPRVPSHRGTVEQQIREPLQPLSTELVVHKTSSSAFNSSPLDQILRNLGTDTLVITGVATNACVAMTARDAADRGYDCVLVEDACASYNEQEHEHFVSEFSRHFGQVMSTEGVIRGIAAHMKKGAPGGAAATLARTSV